MGAIEGKLANDRDATWRRFNSRADAVSALGIHDGNVNEVLNGKRKMAGALQSN